MVEAAGKRARVCESLKVKANPAGHVWHRLPKLSDTPESSPGFVHKAKVLISVLSPR